MEVQTDWIIEATPYAVKSLFVSSKPVTNFLAALLISRDDFVVLSDADVVRNVSFGAF